MIRNVISGEECDSNVDRDLETREYLNREGRRILIITLQGFIFFGTSEKILSEVRAHLADREEHDIEFLVLNFRHVSELDISAIRAFSKLNQLSDHYGFHVLITDTKPRWINRLNSVDFLKDSDDWKHLVFEHMDDAVAWCEEVILNEIAGNAGDNGRDLTSLLSIMIGDELLCREIEPHFVEEHATQGEYLFRQGDAGNSLYLIGAGSVAIVVQAGNGERVLRRFRSGAIVGEMALYTGEPRSAGVLIEEDSALYRLDVTHLKSMEVEQPAAAAGIHSYIVRLLAERVNRLNRELQRV
ncbi:MAG: cyclic nucleotide-binding domain-containing protein [Arenicellales bacterium]